MIIPRYHTQPEPSTSSANRTINANFRTKRATRPGVRETKVLQLPTQSSVGDSANCVCLPAGNSGASAPSRIQRRKLRSATGQHSSLILLAFPLSILLILPFGAAPILFQQDENGSPGTRCFCDKQTCGGGALVCAGKFCLVGVRMDGEGGQGRLDQHCVDDFSSLPHFGASGSTSENGGCARDWSKWSEVCWCEGHLCNTWAHLRGQMESLDGLAAAAQQQSRSVATIRAETEIYAHPLQPEHGHQPHRQGAYDGDDDDDYDVGREARRHPVSIGGEVDNKADHPSPTSNPKSSRRGPALVLLLVVLPLVVGAFTVLLVFLNYHCKML